MNALVLARQPAFSIGPLAVCPATRTVTRDGHEDVLEPRVMQVLVVLAQADDHVVPRDDLVERCWNGRIVGDDAINRVMSRLRRLADGPGRDVFAIETVTKVGYRLRRLDSVAPLVSDGGRPVGHSRRQLVLGGGAALATLGAGGWWGASRLQGSTPPPGTAALMQQAEFASRQMTIEGSNQAVGIYRQVVTDYPDFADGWGSLSMSLAFSSRLADLSAAPGLRQRAAAAARRAFALDPDNPLAMVGMTMSRPLMGNWLRTEQALRAAQQDHPDNGALLLALAVLLQSVGRNREAADGLDGIADSLTANPQTMFNHIRALWSAGRLEEAEKLGERAASLFPTHYAIYFLRLYMLLFSGRAAEALGMARDSARFPTGIAHDEISYVGDVAQVMTLRTPELEAEVLEETGRRARLGAGRAENAVQFAAALGRPDLAIRWMDALFFSRGFVVPDVRFTPMQGTYTPRDDRLTFFLFNPAMTGIRRLPAFARITEELGLGRYWRASGKPPDYLQTP